MKPNETQRRLASLRSALEVVADEDKRRQIKRRIRDLEDQIEASAPADRMETAAMIGAGLMLVLWLAASALLGGCGSPQSLPEWQIDEPRVEAQAVATQVCLWGVCVPVGVAVGWSDGAGKVCLTAPVRVCLPVGGE
jgi:anti-sigma factor RsiW